MKSPASKKHHRRRFFTQFGAAFGTLVAIPSLGIDRFPISVNNKDFPLWPPKKDEVDEKFWEMVKQQFAVPEGMMMVNSANLCPSPHFINDKVSQFQSDLARDVSFQNRNKYGEIKNNAVKMLAAYLGATENEIGLTRNTTESNNIVVNGLDLKKGDEVIIWEQNHPTNNVAWQQRAKRMGFSVKVVRVPANPTRSDELVAPFAEAITTKTRVIAFSHISNVSGLRLPADEICTLARSKDILTLIDGAQAFGFLDLDLHAIGCDFYTGSAHKWLMGPIENGLLYVREQQTGRLWPNIVGAGWSEDRATSADTKFCILGQRNIPSTAAIPDIIHFHNTVGKEIIEQRVSALNQRLKNQLKANIPQVSFVTPHESALSGCIVIFNVAGHKGADVYQKLYHDYGIAGAPTGGIRFSPNVHNTLADMDKIVEAVINVVAG